MARSGGPIRPKIKVQKVQITIIKKPIQPNKIEISFELCEVAGTAKEAVETATPKIVYVRNLIEAYHSPKVTMSMEKTLEIVVLMKRGDDIIVEKELVGHDEEAVIKVIKAQDARKTSEMKVELLYIFQVNLKDEQLTHFTKLMKELSDCQFLSSFNINCRISNLQEEHTDDLCQDAISLAKKELELIQELEPNNSDCLKVKYYYYSAKCHDVRLEIDDNDNNVDVVDEIHNKKRKYDQYESSSNYEVDDVSLLLSSKTFVLPSLVLIADVCVTFRVEKEMKIDE